MSIAKHTSLRIWKKYISYRLNLTLSYVNRSPPWVWQMFILMQEQNLLGPVYTYNGWFSSPLAIFTVFFVGLWNYFNKSIIAFCDLKNLWLHLSDYLTNINEYFTFLEEFVARLTPRWARLLLRVTIIVTRNDNCQT